MVSTYTTRKFSSLQEIEAEPGFIEKNPVDESCFDHPLGHYEFPNKASYVKCCHKKPNGRLCRRAHGWGFVVRLSDGTLSLLGNICQRTKYDEAGDARKKFIRYNNQRVRTEQLSHLKREMEQETERLAELEEIDQALTLLNQKIRKFEADIGPVAVARLKEMRRSDRRDIVIDSLHRTYNDEYDPDDPYDFEYEDTWYSHKVGFIAGLEVFSLAREQIASGIEQVRSAYQFIDQIDDQLKPKQIKVLNEKFKAYNTVKKGWPRIQATAARFFSQDFLPMVFLSDDRGSQVKAMRLRMKATGKSISVSAAEKAVDKAYDHLVNKLGAERITAAR